MAEIQERHRDKAAAALLAWYEMMWNMGSSESPLSVLRPIAQAFADLEAETIERAEKVVHAQARYYLGGDCDGESGHCRAEMEPDRDGDYIELSDAVSAIRALLKPVTPAP